jgi:hypothetical protein
MPLNILLASGSLWRQAARHIPDKDCRFRASGPTVGTDYVQTCSFVRRMSIGSGRLRGYEDT